MAEKYCRVEIGSDCMNEEIKGLIKYTEEARNVLEKISAIFFNRCNQRSLVFRGPLDKH